MTKEFRFFEEAESYALEIYGAVYWDSKPDSLERGRYVVAETEAENNEAIERGLELATGFEGERSRQEYEAYSNHIRDIPGDREEYGE